MRLRVQWGGNAVDSKVVDMDTGKEVCARQIEIKLGYEDHGDSCECSHQVAQGRVLLCEGPNRWVPLDLTKPAAIEVVADTDTAAAVDRITS